MPAFQASDASSILAARTKARASPTDGAFTLLYYNHDQYYETYY